MTHNFVLFVKNSLGVFATRIVMILISLVGSIIVNRILGPANRGAMEVLLLVPYLLVSFGHMGIGNANLYFIGKNKYPIQKVTSNSVSLSLILGTALILIAYVSFYLYRNSLFRGIPFNYTYLAFCIIPFLLFQKFIQYTLLGKEDVKSRNMIVLLPVLINFVVTIFAVVILKLSLMGVLVAIFVSNLSAALLCFYYISQLTEIKVGLDYHLFLGSVKFGVIPFLALVVMNLNFKADVFLIKYYLNDTAVGLYTLGVTVVDKITLLPEAIGLILFSRVSNITEEEARKVTPLVCRFSMFLALIIGGVLFASAGFVVPLVYGREFELSVLPLLILTPGTISLTVFIILHGDLTARGKARVTLYIFSFALVLNILLNLMLIPMFGINGAAIASTVSYTMGGFGLVKAFARINSISFWKLIFPTIEDFREYVVPFARRVQRKVAYL